MKRLLGRFGKKVKATSLKPPTPPVPRPLEEVKQEAGELMAQLGNAQYQVYIYTQDMERLNARLREVNFEGSERIKLDKESETAAKPTESTDVPA